MDSVVPRRRRWAQLAAKSLPCVIWPVRAVHVDHGLQTGRRGRFARPAPCSASGLDHAAPSMILPCHVDSSARACRIEAAAAGTARYLGARAPARGRASACSRRIMPRIRRRPCCCNCCAAPGLKGHVGACRCLSPRWVTGWHRASAARCREARDLLAVRGRGRHIERRGRSDELRICVSTVSYLRSQIWPVARGPAVARARRPRCRAPTRHVADAQVRCSIESAAAVTVGAAARRTAHLSMTGPARRSAAAQQLNALRHLDRPATERSRFHAIVRTTDRGAAPIQRPHSDGSSSEQSRGARTRCVVIVSRLFLTRGDSRRVSGNPMQWLPQPGCVGCPLGDASGGAAVGCSQPGGLDRLPAARARYTVRTARGR